jgi:hypothetical protein
MRRLHRAVLLAATAACGLAQAQTAGLSGSYYALGFSPGTNANAETAITGMTPSATVVATLLCYPSCNNTDGDGTALNAFLGSNATAISPNSIASIEGHVMVLAGFLKIASAGTYTLGLGSDDGSKLVIDGVELSNDGDHGFNTVTQDYALTAGLHPIRILQFEDAGVTGLTVSLNGNALDSTMLQAVPEPASWATLLAGVGLAGFVAGRRRG